MALPTQAPPVIRRRLGAGAFRDVAVSAPTNTCECSGDQTYNQCSVTRNDCLVSYYPVCNAGAYNCGCTCTPG